MQTLDQLCFYFCRYGRTRDILQSVSCADFNNPAWSAHSQLRCHHMLEVVTCLHACKAMCDSLDKALAPGTLLCEFRILRMVRSSPHPGGHDRPRPPIAPRRPGDICLTDSRQPLHFSDTRFYQIVLIALGVARIRWWWCYALLRRG